MQVYLYPTGDVRVCCRSRLSLGNVANRSLLDIWRGARRQELIDHLQEDDFSLGCEGCGAEVSLEGRRGSFPSTFDYWHEKLDATSSFDWPSRMEFNLSTLCNLQCIQCSGESSSSIRIHREKRRPLGSVYGEQFFADLELFIPHLRAASFAGGEPFMALENFVVWDMVEELAPDLPCTVITNATHWNERIEAVLDRLHVNPIVSIDGATRSTYESIRVGARFEEVVCNIDRLVDYSRQRRRQMSLNFCLMPENATEFPDMLLFAEQRGLPLNVCVVRSPAERSLTRLDSPTLSSIVGGLEERSAQMQASLEINLDTWDTEVARLQAWLASSDPGGSPAAQRIPVILMFRRQGDGPVDVALEIERLAGGSEGSVIHTVDIGPDERVGQCSRELARRLGLAVGEIEGAHLSVLLRVIRRYEVLDIGEDRYEASFDLDDSSVRMVLIPVRDGSGWADGLTAVFAFRPRVDRLTPKNS